MEFYQVAHTTYYYGKDRGECEVRDLRVQSKKSFAPRPGEPRPGVRSHMTLNEIVAWPN
jgi:hypothetical protein